MWVSIASQIVTSLVGIKLTATLVNYGLSTTLKLIASFLLSMPGVNLVLKWFTKREIKGMVESFTNEKSKEGKLIAIPEKGIPHPELYKNLEEIKSKKQNLFEDGRMFAFVYTKDNPHFEIQKKAFKMFTDFNHGNDPSFEGYEEVVKAYLDVFMHDNALNPVLFPTLRKFENEVVSMTASMLNGDSNVLGTVTSGGTESVLMAIKAYRDRASKFYPNITKPNIVVPVTIHPAFEKAGHYFCVELRHVPVCDSSRTCSARDMEAYIDKNTILLVGSAPSYPQAIMDPIEDIAKLALKYNLPMHVDACYGGFILPWLEKIGRPIPKWDFRVDGVTSISADLHKYGFIAKGASVVCYKNEELRKFQYYSYSGWSGGLFVASTMAGTRPGTHLAAAWAGMRAIGQDGYKQSARDLICATEKMINGINSIESLFVFGDPLMTGFGFGSTDKRVNVFAIVDTMDKKGWKLEVQRNPDSIHCTILPGHVTKAEQWVDDLKQSVKEIKINKIVAKDGVEAMYGMLGIVPNDAIIDDFMIDLFSNLYKL